MRGKKIKTTKAPKIAEKRAAVTYSEADLIWGGNASASGEVVTAETAMRVGAVYTAVKILAETLAMFPLNVYQRTYKNGREGRQIAKDHPLQKLLHSDKTNNKQNCFEYKEMQQARLALRGNAYSYIQMNGKGQIQQLIPLHPDYIVAEEQENSIIYSYYSKKGRIAFAQDEILHIKCLPIDGIIGMSPIEQMVDMIGTTISMDKHGANSFKNGVKLGGILKYPKSLSPRTMETIRSSWERQYSGSNNSGKTAILEQGIEFEPIAMNNEQAQWLDAMKMKRSEIAGIFRIPPHMMGDLERATFSNIEQMSLEFVQFTMMPWLVRWESAMNAALFTDAEQEEYFIKFNEKALLRGDGLARAQKLQIERMNGIITANEWRALEEYNPIEDESGDIYLIPMNMADASEPIDDKSSDGGQPPRTPGAQQQEPAATDSNLNRAEAGLSTAKFSEIFNPILLSTAERIAIREFKAQEKKEDKAAWAKDYSAKNKETLSEFVESIIVAASRAVSLKDKNSILIDRFVSQYSESLESDIIGMKDLTQRTSQIAAKINDIILSSIV